jgi:hypothetical protein
LARHKHRKQRPWHEYRYGFGHWLQHQRGTPHSHRRRVRVDPDTQWALEEDDDDSLEEPASRIRARGTPHVVPAATQEHAAVVAEGGQSVVEGGEPAAVVESGQPAVVESGQPAVVEGTTPTKPRLVIPEANRARGHRHGEPSGASSRSTRSTSRRSYDDSERRKAKLRRRRIIAVVVLFLIAAALLLALSAAYSIIKARHDLEGAKEEIDAVTHSPNSLLSHHARAQTAQVIAHVQADVQAANHILSISPGVAAMWALPYLHTQRQVLMNLITDIDATTTSGRALLTSVNTLVAHSHGTTLSIPDLRALHQQIVLAHARLAPLGHSSPGLFPLLPPLASAETVIDRDLNRLTGLLADGQQLTKYAMAFLGANGPRTYFLAAENNAEMRDQGAVLSYAILTTDNGTFSVSSPSSISNIQLTSPANVPTPAGTQQAFAGYEPTQVWQSVNAPADFPWTGADVQAMYAQATGQHVDGVVALDVPGLASILRLVGPVQVPGVAGKITASNVATVTLHDLYQGVPASASQVARRDVLSSIAKAAVDKMKHEHVDIAAFADALAKDAGGRHLLAWDSVPSYEATIAKFGGSGAIDTNDPTRTFHVAVEDGAANKLDYYTDVKLSENVVITPSGNADVTTTVTAVNTTPPGVPSGYQYGPDGVVTHIPGQYVGHVFLWGPRGASQVASVPQAGLTLSNQTVEALPGQSDSVQFLTVIHHAVRDGEVHLVFVPQPRLAPEHLTIHMGSQGWKMTGPPVVHASLTKTLSWTWTATH